MSEHNQPPIATLDPPIEVSVPVEPDDDDRVFTALGVRITDVTRRRATELLEAIVCRDDGRTRCVYCVNTHTLNLTAADPQYRDVLNAADYVFGDGTGVRWAARLQGIRVRENLCGTDLTPQLLRSTAGRGYRYFLLGGTEETIRDAARFAEETFTGWTLAGFHHGYLTDNDLCARVVRQINDSRPHLLLVGMGNPLQEQWIYRYQHELQMPLCMAVGGLFGYWADNLQRSPMWLRRYGAEWLGILLQQPHKVRRYLLGNPSFLARILRQWWKDRGEGSG